MGERASFFLITIRGRRPLKQAGVKSKPHLAESFPLCSLAEGRRTSLLTDSERMLCIKMGSRHVFGAPWSGTSDHRWPAAVCSVSVILTRFFCSSVGVISPQDAVTAELDVMENYHFAQTTGTGVFPSRLTNISTGREGGETKAQIER